jgi:hypothetical protein
MIGICIILLFLAVEGPLKFVLSTFYVMCDGIETPFVLIEV